MRGRALLGGAALLSAVFLWHREPLVATPADLDGRPRCHALGAGLLCDAVGGLTKTVHQSSASINASYRLPPRDVPGAIDPDITQRNIDATICQSGYSRSSRPPYSVTGRLKRRMMLEQHSGEPLANYELDHLVPISLGGAPLDARNLWLQPRSGHANAGDKNILAYVLWRLTCEHRLPLATAQRAISRNWIEAYDTYATPQNVAKYHFRHAAARERGSYATPPPRSMDHQQH